MSGKTLSIQQIKFCEQLASGKSQREAYNIAYPKAKRSDIVTDAAASRLLSNVKVFTYYQSLLKQNATNSQIDRAYILSKYQEIIEQRPDGQIVKNADRLKALELTAKMLGLNEPDKLDLTSKGESMKPMPQIIVQTEEQKVILESLIGKK